MKKGNNLAVILLNYKDADTVINYAKVIEKYSYIDKIIVVDNQSPDDSFKRLKKLSSNKVDVVRASQNKGYAAGNNFGIKYLIKKYGNFNYIAISNSDVEVSEPTFKKCVNFLSENDDVAICAPRMYDINKEPTYYSAWKFRTLFMDSVFISSALSSMIYKNELHKYNHDYIDNHKFIYVDCVMGSFFIIKGDIFKKVNYFDENTFLYEEEDILGKKIQALGYKTVMLNTCHYVHYVSITINKSLNTKAKNKILYKSMRYYHLNYDEKCNKRYNQWKIVFFDLVRLFKPIDRFCFYFLKGFHLLFNWTTYIWKLLILLIHIPLYPFIYIYKKVRKNKRLLYLSKLPYDFSRDSLIKKYINKNNYKIKNVYFYKYKDLLEDANNYVTKNKITNYKAKHYDFTFRPRWYILFINSFWIYDEIIIDSSENNYYFFMLIHRMRKTKISFEKIL